MSIRRYARTPIYGLNSRYGTSKATVLIRNGVNNGGIRTQTYVTKENERLDILAGQYYGDGTLWWIIAAGSNIGWCLQVPSNTKLNIPLLEDVSQVVG
jgi:hypothetical protein